MENPIELGCNDSSQTAIKCGLVPLPCVDTRASEALVSDFNGDSAASEAAIGGGEHPIQVGQQSPSHIGEIGGRVPSPLEVCKPSF